MSININDKAPDFTLPANNGKTITLSSFLGKKVVLYFYPKDDTPGCTKEACAFRDDYKKFVDSNTVIIGISKDSIKRHENFIQKYDLPFILVSDENEQVCEAYGVWVEKNMYGKKYMGIDRSTFLIDEKGFVKKVWRKVKVAEHVHQVIRELE
jgi:peroxiredoxin Q/BCP